MGNLFSGNFHFIDILSASMCVGDYSKACMFQCTSEKLHGYVHYHEN